MVISLRLQQVCTYGEGLKFLLRGGICFQKKGREGDHSGLGSAFICLLLKEDHLELQKAHL